MRPEVLKLHVRVCGHVDLKDKTDEDARVRLAIKRCLLWKVEAYWMICGWSVDFRVDQRHSDNLNWTVISYNILAYFIYLLFI
jgi:hypothetical protein